MTRLGQHFLADANLLHKIVAALDPRPDDVVLEIGAGTGNLTRMLAPQVGRVIAIERDRGLASECGMRNAECGIDNTTIVQGDALTIDWLGLLDAYLDIPHSPFPIPHFKVLGNIPYYITSPLLAKALTPPLPERVVFLVQREVADRLVARPGTKQYGALSVGVQASCVVERLFVVRAGAFRPPPKVDSALVRLTPRAQPLVAAAEAAEFRTFVTACFSRRRKQLRNAVMAATGKPRAVVSELLAGLALAPDMRPEAVSPENFVRLYASPALRLYR